MRRLDSVTYFDGTSARAHQVSIELDGGRLLISGDGISRTVPERAVQWPERTTHGGRVAHLEEGGSLHCDDGARWDRWATASGRSEPLAVAWQQSWGRVALCLAAVVLVLAALQLHGIPWLARMAVAAIPARVEAPLGDAALNALDAELMRPSALAATEQTRIRAAFARALAAFPADSVPDYRIEFRKSRIGPNALALPGGTMVLTDEMVELAGSNEALLNGVLAHEFGHLRERHAMRSLVQAAAIGAITTLVLGDFSTLEADAESVRVLKSAGLSPLVMIDLFDRLEKKSGAAASSDEGGIDRALGISISSHPADAERIAFFRQAATR